MFFIYTLYCSHNVICTLTWVFIRSLDLFKYHAYKVWQLTIVGCRGSAYWSGRRSGFTVTAFLMVFAQSIEWVMVLPTYFSCSIDYGHSESFDWLIDFCLFCIRAVNFLTLKTIDNWFIDCFRDLSFFLDIFSLYLRIFYHFLQDTAVVTIFP